MSHMPRSMRVVSKCRATHTNSPANVRRTYIFDVYGSKHSLLPKIWEVDAVGIGATNKLFLTPYFLISFLKPFQSQFSLLDV